GCHTTAALLPLVPFLRADLVEPGPVIIDSKSGVSGARRKREEGYLFSELAENTRAYGVAHHRHLPEIEQEATLAAGRPVGVTFVAHLLPTIRGMSSTVYLRPKRRLSAE